MGRKAIGWIAALAILAALAGGAAFALTGADPAGEGEVRLAGDEAGAPVPAATADAGSSVAVAPAATPDAAATPATPATVEATPEATPEPTSEPTPEPTPEATPEPTPEATPEPTPEPTPEATPEATPEPTPEATPEPTPEPTPEATPEPTPEPTPEATPEPTPGLSGNAAVIAALRAAGRTLTPPSHTPTAADMDDLVQETQYYGNVLQPRAGGWRVCVSALYQGSPIMPDWLTLGDLAAITEIAVAAWNAMLEPDPFRPPVAECPGNVWGVSLPKDGWIVVGFIPGDGAGGYWGGREVSLGRDQSTVCAPLDWLAGVVVHELGHGLGLGHGGHGVMHSHGSCDPVPRGREAAVAQRFFHGAPARIEHYRNERRRLLAAEASAPAGPAFVPPLRDGQSGQLVLWRSRGETDEAAIAAALERDSCSRITRVSLFDSGTEIETYPRSADWPLVMTVAEHHALDVSRRQLADGRIFYQLVLDGGRLVPGAFLYDSLWLVDCA